jgi:hypothetical protein
VSRSPFAYPLVRNIDGDAGGAADLQTDIMRFMAILALCLMAIFALVQSIPLAPVAPPTPEPVAPPAPEPVAEAVPERTVETKPPAVERKPPAVEPKTATKPAEKAVVLTRPKWVSTFTPAERPQPATVAEELPEKTSEPAPAEPEPAPVEEPDGFTLRFESDQALMRLVATSQVGFYAIAGDRAQRMSVAASRISFWDASTPNEYHEMEVTTVPAAVIDALRRSGEETGSVAWGVTLPGKLTVQLESLMKEHRGGSLVIGKDGGLRLEAS